MSMCHAVRVAARASVVVAAVVGLSAPAYAAETAPSAPVVEDVDLVSGPADAKTEARPGVNPAVPIEIRNAGTKAVPGVVMHLTMDRPLLNNVFSNCWYDRPIDYLPAEMICEFDVELAPGTTYKLAEPPLGVFRGPAETNATYAYEHHWYTADRMEELGWLTRQTSMPRYNLPRNGRVLALEPAAPVVSGEHAKVFDSNDANNTSRGTVVIGASAVSPSPSASGSSSPSASAPAAPSASAAPARTASAAPTGGAVAGSAGSGAGTGGALAITGAKTAVVAMIGGVLVAGGLAAFFVGRRRKASFTA
ncbi:LPXTG cell wall anchor domain-containing protein [Actinoplanes sp. NPDC051859]|uniref:LPXTG cell wall anchor domain-containing protein n=1 Tax=Actinoplanes sp. NPDC051859 TaxID=3363909 RepID=UPI0037BA6AAD